MSTYSTTPRRDYCTRCNQRRAGQEINRKFWCNSCLQALQRQNQQMQMNATNTYQQQQSYQPQQAYRNNNNNTNNSLYTNSTMSRARKSGTGDTFKLNIAQIRAQRKSQSPGAQPTSTFNPTSNKPKTRRPLLQRKPTPNGRNLLSLENNHTVTRSQKPTLTNRSSGPTTSDLQQQNIELKATLEIAMKEREALKSKIDQLLNLGNDITLYDYNQLRQDFDKLMDQAEVYEKDASRLGSKADEMKREIKRYIQQNKEIMKERDDLATQKQEYETEYEQLQQQCEMLVDSTSNKIKGYEQKIAKKDKDIQNLQNTVLSMQRQLNTQSSLNNADIQEVYAELEGERRLRELAEENLVSKQEYFEFQLQQKQDEIEHLKTQLFSLQRPTSSRSNMGDRPSSGRHQRTFFSVKDAVKNFDITPVQTPRGPKKRNKKRKNHKQNQGNNRNSNGSDESKNGGHNQQHQNQHRESITTSLRIETPSGINTINAPGIYSRKTRPSPSPSPSPSINSKKKKSKRDLTRHGHNHGHSHQHTTHVDTNRSRRASIESLESTSSHQSNKSLNSISSYNSRQSTGSGLRNKQSSHPRLAYHAYNHSNSALQATNFSVPRRQPHSVMLSRKVSNQPAPLVNHNPLDGVGLTNDASESETDNESLYDVMEQSREATPTSVTSTPRTAKPKHKNKRKGKGRSIPTSHLIQRDIHHEKPDMYKQKSGADEELEKIRKNSGGSVRQKAKDFAKKHSKSGYGHNYKSSNYVKNNEIFASSYISKE